METTEDQVEPLARQLDHELSREKVVSHAEGEAQMARIRLRGYQALECFRQGKMAADSEDLDLALSWFEEAIRIDPGQFLGLFGRGFVHHKRGEYEQAIADFSEALRLCPGDPVTYYYRSLSYESKGDEVRQRADYEQALALDPNLDLYITAFWNPCPCGKRMTYQVRTDGRPSATSSAQGGHTIIKERS